MLPLVLQKSGNPVEGKQQACFSRSVGWGHTLIQKGGGIQEKRMPLTPAGRLARALQHNIAKLAVAGTL